MTTHSGTAPPTPSGHRMRSHDVAPGFQRNPVEANIVELEGET